MAAVSLPDKSLCPTLPPPQQFAVWDTSIREADCVSQLPTGLGAFVHPSKSGDLILCFWSLYDVIAINVL